MDIRFLFTPEMIILVEALLILVMGLYMIITRDFTHGIYIWLLSVLFFRFQKLDLANSVYPDLSIDRVLFAFLVSIFVIEVLSRKQKLSRLTGIECSMFLFCLFAVVSMIWTGFIIKRGGRLQIGDLITGYITPFAMFVISKNVYETYRKQERFIKFIILVGLYLCLTAVFEHFHITGFIWPKYILNPSLGIHFGRARGPFVQAAINGTALGFVLLASFYFLLNSKASIIWRHSSVILLILAPLAIFFTYTRACWLGALLGFALIMMFVVRSGKRLLAIGIITLCILGFISALFLVDYNTVSLASERLNHEQPVYERLNLYIASMNMFMHHPLFGVGFGRFLEHAPNYSRYIEGIRYYSPRTIEHDTFVGILAEMGLVGIFLILTIYFKILSKSIRLYRSLGLNGTRERVMVMIFWGVTAVYVINSIFIEMKYAEFVNCLFFIFAGIICGMERLNRNERTV